MEKVAQMEWQTLADIARDCAALPKAGFKERFPAPFLLELDPEVGEAIDTTAETRDFNPESIKNGGMSPSLTKSRIVNFGEGEAFTVGRSEKCHIVCTQETVSEEHCKFESFGSIWSILELGSKNGTFLSTRKMTAGEQAPLKYGTKIILGEAQFLFLSTEEAFDLIQDLSKEPRIRPRSLGKLRKDFKDAGEAAEVRKQFPGPFLVVQAPKGREAAKAGEVSSNTITLSQEDLKKGINKNVTDAVFNLGNHSLVRIGRATVTQIHLPLGAISNLHAALVRGDEGKWEIQDMGAKNGTYLWGDRLEGKKDLESGTEIMLGNIKSIFFNIEDLLTYALHRDTLV